MFKKTFKLLFLAFLALIFTLITTTKPNISNVFATEKAIIAQDKTLQISMYQISKLYYKNNLIGVVKDLNKLESDVKQMKDEHIQSSPLSLIDDIVIINEYSYFQYENKDSEILNYLTNNNYIAHQSTGIQFERGEVIYVQNIEDFEYAVKTFESYFTSKNTSNVSEEIVSIENTNNFYYFDAVVEDERLLKDTPSILSYLEYSGTTKNTYDVLAYDTIAGVASKFGITSENLVSINQDTLTSSEQLLFPDQKLNVSYFNSPLNIEVKKNVQLIEIVYPSAPVYEIDESLFTGEEVILSEAVVGYDKVNYLETYVNGVLQENSQETKRSTITPPSAARIKIGNKKLPNVGYGKFRYPIDNPVITCGWFCYSGHTASDIQNKYNRYGNVYASDRGEVVEVGYNQINGYYVWINHNNGYRTYYGHMNLPAYVQVGDVVEQGQSIGQIGKTGKVTGPLVHFVIEYNGVRYNPYNYLSKWE